jgi:hypothetical protein
MDEKREEKKQYDVPVIETEETFETMAMACCKIESFCFLPPVGIPLAANAS